MLLTLCAALVLPFASAAPARAAERELCRFDLSLLPEISGLATSTIHRGIVWAHNDSGAQPRIYALDVRTCEVRAVITVRGVAALDPEAIAAGRNAEGTPVLWWGDIGDNTAQRRFVAIHEIPEPTRLVSTTVDPITYRVQLREPEDAEALIADGDQLWMVSKGLTAGTIWKLPKPLKAGGVSRATAVGAELSLVTDAAMRPGGGYAVRDYSEVRIYAGTPPGQLLDRVPLDRQVQGEAMTWTRDGSALILASEGDDRLLRVAVRTDTSKGSTSARSVASTPAPVRTKPARANAASSPSPSETALTVLEPVDRIGSMAVVALGVAAVVFVASSAFVIASVRSRPDE